MAAETFKRKLTAILSADVKGYSRLMKQDEEATVRTLTTYRQVIGAVIEKHRGRVVDSPGDNLLAEFASVVDAVRSAVEIQEELKTRNAELPQDRKMEFRIGVNLGDVIEEGERIYGDGVNIAARVEGLAEGGGICISGTVYEHVKDKLALGYEYLGEHEVKNIAEPVRVYRAQIEPGAAPEVSREKKPRLRHWQWATLVVMVILAGAFAIWKFYLRPSPPHVEPASEGRMAFPLPDKPSIAVLPFLNMSGDPEQEYFSDGITDDLITDLSKISSLFVMARNSTFAYKDKPVKIHQVAEELGVRYILEGSVRKVGAKVRINTQLIDATAGHHVWAERYDGTVGDIFALQDRITRKIVSALAVKLTAGEEDHVAGRGTDNVQAYDAFLKGWGHHRHITPEDFEKAVSYFEKAIELDPNYGRAYAALALAFWRASFRDDFWRARPGLMYRDIRMRAFEFLKMALNYPTSLAHVVNSHYVLESHRRHEQAIAEAQRAITLDPNDPSGHNALAYALIMAGRPEEAVDFAKKAMRLDPHSPGDYLYTLGLAHFCMGKLEEAVTLIERALTHNPQAYGWAAPLAAAYAHLGRDKEAWDVLENYRRAVRKGITLKRAMYYWPFKDMEVSERFADGLLKAGLVGQPSGYYKIYEDNRLTGEEIKALLFGRKITGRGADGGKWWLFTTKDGWTRQSNAPTGTASIQGDLVCFHWHRRQAYGDMKIRHAVFRNPEGKPERNDEYLSVTDHIEIWSWSPTD